jgi:hypothetical protein
MSSASISMASAESVRIKSAFSRHRFFGVLEANTNRFVRLDDYEGNSSMQWIFRSSDSSEKVAVTVGYDAI